jgi:disulfide oxidoreductase YuzD
MQNLDKVIELKKIYNSIDLYLYVQNNEYKYVTKKLDKVFVDKLKEKLKNATKQKIEKYDQTEYFFNNLIMNEKIYSNGTNFIEYKSIVQSELLFANDCLYILQKYNPINRINFPQLLKYDRVEIKKIEKYDFIDFEVYFVLKDGESVIFVKLKNLNNSNKKSLSDLLEILK